MSMSSAALSGPPPGRDDEILRPYDAWKALYEELVGTPVIAQMDTPATAALLAETEAALLARPGGWAVRRIIAERALLEIRDVIGDRRKLKALATSLVGELLGTDADGYAALVATLVAGERRLAWFLYRHTQPVP
mgnify:CR=1 FL=1